MKKLWEFFSSIKLTVYLILAIVGLTVYGSLVVYFRPDIYGALDQFLFFSWLLDAGVKNVGSSWWFFVLVFLAVLLGINQFVCIADRFPKFWKRYNNSTLNMRDLKLGGDNGRELAITGGDTAIDGVLAGSGYTVYRQGRNIYAEKHGWIPFVPFAIHIGVILFLLAHLISGTTGYRNPGTQISEGDTVKSPAGDWSIRLDKLNVELDQQGNLKSYASTLSALKDGKVVKTGVAKTNTPFFAMGAAIYQREPGQAFRGFFSAVDIPAAGFHGNVYIPKGADTVVVPGTTYKLRIDRYLSNFAVDERGEPYSESEELINPAMVITILNGATQVGGGWVFIRDPRMDTFKSAVASVRLADIDVRPYVSFDINRDPSVWLAVLASSLVMFGSFITLYVRRERVWMTFDNASGMAQAVCTDDDVYVKLTS